VSVTTAAAAVPSSSETEGSTHGVSAFPGCLLLLLLLLHLRSLSEAREQMLTWNAADGNKATQHEKAPLLCCTCCRLRSWSSMLGVSLSVRL
jgi:hypothetical protein